MSHEYVNGRMHPLEPTSWSWFLRCPVCLDEVTIDQDVHCHRCGRRFPIAHGIPYLSVVDKRWRDHLREIINYFYFYRKIMSRSVEQDRLESDAEHQKLTFQVMA
ncbi:MAG TPA: hypothetical protein PKH07_19285, partial [bacterium]|nr:hypothetical protein [bacterium]